MLETWLHQKQGQLFYHKMDKMEYALALLGNPHRTFPIIHIAGTNGKGSTIAFMKELLQGHGLKVGTFVSPHMLTVHDRICINGIPISDEQFQLYLRKVYDLEQIVEKRYEGFRYFEVMTLMMFLYFQEEQPDIALIEVGIGGLLDTTNVVSPLLSIVTSVGRDHQDLLGESLEEIAEQKAGIIKEKTPVILGPMTSESLQVMEEKAASLQAPLYVFGESFWYKKHRFSNQEWVFSDRGLGLFGRHQEENAAVALQAFFLYMKKCGKIVQDEVCKRALSATRWAGRLELVSLAPTIYLDGAHNVPAIERVIEFMEKESEPLTILFSALKRKDFQAMLELLEERLPQASLVLTSFAYDGGLSVECCQGRRYVEDYQAFIRNFEKNGDGTLLVTGSLYFISEVRKILKNEEK